ncbi:MAG: hypothetical protein AW07_03189 [Candidatus Accumulibacter sp. SK-11]|nr:MAG: hypothetical protein AW07_03189 [Candidatus Accumulibacter sp. SK-11]
MSKGARPRADQTFRGDVAGIEDLQRAEELTAKEGLPPSVAGERGERSEQRPLAEVAPEVALDTPDGDDGVRVDSVALGGGGERRSPLLPQHQRVGDPLVVHQAGEVIPDRRAELGLVVEELQHAHVRAQPFRQAIESRCRHAFRRCVGAQSGHARRKAVAGSPCLRGGGVNDQAQAGEEDGASSFHGRMQGQVRGRGRGGGWSAGAVSGCVVGRATVSRREKQCRPARGGG